MAKETAAAKRQRSRRIVDRLARAYPDATISLRHQDPFQLLVAVVLSAQCTDARVNMVTPSLFARFPDAASLAEAEPAEVERLIHSTGFFRSKTRHLIGAARRIRDAYGGSVPGRMEDLLTLPGVARKTANVVLWNGFGRLDGVAVDTHVHRITRLLRLTRHHEPAKIEKDLVALVPRRRWGDFTHLVIAHGRAVCIANRPRCGECVLNDLCPSRHAPRLTPPSSPQLPQGPRRRGPPASPSAKPSPRGRRAR